MKIPFFEFRDFPKGVIEEEEKTLLKAYRSGHYVLGRYKKIFEEKYRDYVGVSHCIGVSSGYDALLLALKATVKPHTKVILPANTFKAVLLAVLNHSCTPVFADVDASGNISIPHVALLIDQDVSALIGVHTHGNPLDALTLREFCDRNKVVFIEDFSQAHGAEFNQIRCGAFGHINAASLYPTKVLGAKGDAGVITTDDEALMRKVRSLQDYGYKSNEAIGVNARLDELQAAMLTVRLEYMGDFITERSRIAQKLDESVASCKNLTRAEVLTNATPSWYVYNVFCEDRDLLKAHLESYQITTKAHYSECLHHTYSGVKEYNKDLLQTESFSNTCLSLPFFPGMKDEEIAYVTAALLSFFK